MRLKPRYSLLTLLVLTALVAGGVKWWRGPHRVIYEQPFQSKQPFVDDATFDIVSDFFLTYEFEYTRTWSSQRIHYHAARPQPNHFMTRFSNIQNEEGRTFWGFHDQLSPEFLSRSDLGPPERIALWITPPKDGYPTDLSDQLQAAAKKRSRFPNYIVTDRQRIFQVDSTSHSLRFGIVAVIVDIMEIPYPLVRDRIREEFAKQK